MQTNLTVEGLAQLLRDAESAHAQFERNLGHSDPDWPRWYAQYILEQIGSADAS